MKAIVGIITTILLILSYFSIGYLFCAETPYATQLLAEMSIDASSSPFDKEALVRGALATRDYSFGSHDADAFYETILQMNEGADTPFASESAEGLKGVADAFSIDSTALSHLDDVANIADAASTFSTVVIVLAVIFSILCLIIGKKRLLGKSLIASGILVIVLFVLLGIWAGVSFDGLFAAFHSLLFDAGTWTFPMDSLLITMLPEGFWIGMATIWLIVSVLLALISLIIGTRLAKKRR